MDKTGKDYDWYTWKEYKCHCHNECDDGEDEDSFAVKCPREGLRQGYDKCFKTTGCYEDTGDGGAFILDQTGKKYDWYTWAEYDCYCENECGPGEGEQVTANNCPEYTTPYEEDKCFKTTVCDESNGTYVPDETGTKFIWYTWDEYDCHCRNKCGGDEEVGEGAKNPKFPGLYCPEEGKQMWYDACYRAPVCWEHGDFNGDYYFEHSGWVTLMFHMRYWEKPCRQW